MEDSSSRQPQNFIKVNNSPSINTKKAVPDIVNVIFTGSSFEKAHGESDRNGSGMSGLENLSGALDSLDSINLINFDDNAVIFNGNSAKDYCISSSNRYYPPINLYEDLLSDSHIPGEMLLPTPLLLTPSKHASPESTPAPQSPQAWSSAPVSTLVTPGGNLKSLPFKPDLTPPYQTVKFNSQNKDEMRNGQKKPNLTVKIPPNVESSGALNTSTDRPKTQEAQSKRKAYSFVELMAYRYSPMSKEVISGFSPDVLSFDLLQSPSSYIEGDNNRFLKKKDNYVIPSRRELEDKIQKDSIDIKALNDLIMAHNRDMALMGLRVNQLLKRVETSCKSTKWIPVTKSKNCVGDQIDNLVMYQEGASKRG